MAGPDEHFDEQTKLELEAAAFRSLMAHLDERKDVQNIDLMNLAGFCRNCMSKWYLAAAEDRGQSLDYEGAREIVYGRLIPSGRINFKQRRRGRKKKHSTKISRSDRLGSLLLRVRLQASDIVTRLTAFDLLQVRI